MSGFMVLRLDRCLPLVRQVDVNGFKFFYELLAISRGRLKVGEIPLHFQPRLHGSSKLDLAVIWDFVVSLIHTATLRLLPRKAISFGLVGATGSDGAVAVHSTADGHVQPGVPTGTSSGRDNSR